MSLSTLKRHKSTHDQSCSMSAASQALRRYRNDGIAIADPKDEAQCRLYMQLRTAKPRATAQEFLTFMKNARQEITTGAKAETSYWGVPKINFPHGLPEEIERAIADENTLAEMEAQSGEMKLDPLAYWVVDMMIDRSLLGKNVVTLKFYTGGVTKSKAPVHHPHDSDPHAASSGSLSMPAAAGALPSSQLPK